MQTIHVKQLDGWTYEVAVDGRVSTTHIVTVGQEYIEKLTAGRLAAEELIRHSFEFLLERESNSSILRRFDLAVIAQYFPEYEQTMRQRLLTQ